MYKSWDQSICGRTWDKLPYQWNQSWVCQSNVGRSAKSRKITQSSEEEIKLLFIKEEFRQEVSGRKQTVPLHIRVNRIGIKVISETIKIDVDSPNLGRLLECTSSIQIRTSL